uniref:Uridylate-specific endoribonuclease n=1 Tax=Erpetoichthys calabaricus TaxID=27687 RepID=A0A8C4T900_ERPCA
MCPACLGSEGMVIYLHEHTYSTPILSLFSVVGVIPTLMGTLNLKFEWTAKAHVLSGAPLPFSLLCVSGRLYTFVDEATLFTKPTYAALIKLLDNYNRMTGTAEHFTKEQVAEQEAFLKKVVTDTEIGRQLSTFLLAKGVYTSEAELIQDLQMMWFGLYSRNKGQLDSSGFEHVFVGEIKSSKVSGFHNWVQFYLLERRGQLNYYSHNFDGPWAGFPDILGMQFNWSGYFKEVGSAFIGSSPEFDFAIYSLCYITRPGKMCHLSLGGKAQSIQTYTWTNSFYGDGKMFIASAYPVSP